MENSSSLEKEDETQKKKQKVEFVTKECLGLKLGGYYLRLKDHKIVQVQGENSTVSTTNVELKHFNGPFETVALPYFNAHYREMEVYIDV